LSTLAVFYEQQLNSSTLGKETPMDTLATKLAALAGTILMNTLLLVGVACCFAIQPNTNLTAVALAKAVAAHQGLG
jgi:hypothetical protein